MAVGKVIKSEELPPGPEKAAPRPRAGVMTAETYDAKTEARAILESAQREREAILAAAEAEREDIAAAARERGYQEGIAKATELLVRTKMQVGQMQATHEQDVLTLALKMAEKIIGVDLERDPKVLAHMVANAIEAARYAKALIIRVNPTNGAQIRGNESAWREVLGKTVDITFRDDADVEINGCVIQTEFGTIDAQLTTQLRMLKNVLLPDDGKSEGPA